MKSWTYREIAALLCLMGSLVLPARALGNAVANTATEDLTFTKLSSPENVAQFFRDRFQIPEGTKVAAQPAQHSPLPHFYQTVVTVDDGKQRRTLNAFISDDAQCFAVGSIIALSGASEADIIRCVREAANLPANVRISVSPAARTTFKNFLRSTITVELGTRTEKGELYLTQDHKLAILGLALPFRNDFVEQLIDTKNQPMVGPATAPVTIVEYTDLECPGCALFQKFLETEFLPKYQSKVKFVFKEFPLSFHTWSITAAVANECAYQIDPSTFANYRSLIFGDQPNISVNNIRDRLLNLGQQAGLDRVKLSTCIDTKASRSRVEKSHDEALNLGISGTPTFVINGRVVTGPFSPGTFYKMVDDAVAASREPR